ncbi:MAG: tRNA (adenosine(37)-N6)-threonylcarbamoyltransferase complex ATPase subunit type 1 TsaE [Pseudomonadota bacterium]
MGPSSPKPIATEPVVLEGEGATAALGARLASVLRPGDVVGLRGDLGAGKSTLARACLRSLAGAAIEVPSPTFTLVQIYDLPACSVWHVDLYRLADPAEVDELGLEEALDRAALLIEWPERLPEGAFADRLEIGLRTVDAAHREVRIEAGPSWQARLSALTGQATD